MATTNPKRTNATGCGSTTVNQTKDSAKVKMMTITLAMATPEVSPFPLPIIDPQLGRRIWTFTSELGHAVRVLTINSASNMTFRMSAPNPDKPFADLKKASIMNTAKIIHGQLPVSGPQPGPAKTT